MEEIVPGVMHWSAVHPNTGLRAHSYFHVASATLIDPIAPDEGFGWFERHAPRRALLTNRHHLRGAPEFADAFGCTIHCHPAGLHEFDGGPDVQPMEPGDTFAPGITVLEFGAITPEEVVLAIDAGPGALAFADGLIRLSDGMLGFFPDELLGDDPEAVKRDLHAALRRLLEEQEFDALLLAHGKPRASGGRAELARFA
jgi:Metallo-beta-lactamase superfamily